MRGKPEPLQRLADVRKMDTPTHTPNTEHIRWEGEEEEGVVGAVGVTGEGGQ